jgi:hypothetical protein
LFYFFLNLAPVIIFKIYDNLDLRHTYEGKIFLLDFINISISQNVNGQARILFILQLFFLIMFKKYTKKKKFVSHILFYISTLLLFFIILMQSRYIIAISCISSFCIVITNHILNFKKKIFYLFFLIFIIISASIISKSERVIYFDYKNILYDKLNNFHINEYSQKNLISQCSKNININKADALLSGRICGWEILIKNLDKDLLFGKGFLADQLLLKSIQKTSSNSWINILFNTGILSLVIIFLFITFFLFKHFKVKNINHQNIYICLSYYLAIFVLLRSLLEDTITFLNIDLMIVMISLLIIKNSNNKITT